jgi:hypothetical protein
MFTIQLIKDANHAQLITLSTMLLKLATVKYHVNSPDNLTPTTSANAQSMAKELKESSMKLLKHVPAQLTYHSGTESSVLPVQLVLNSILNNNNAITVQKDSLEMFKLALVFQGSD